MIMVYTTVPSISPGIFMMVVMNDCTDCHGGVGGSDYDDGDDGIDCDGGDHVSDPYLSSLICLYDSQM